MRGVWFLGVDVGTASDAWVARVHALAPRPRGSVRSLEGRAFLAALEGLQAHAARERAAGGCAAALTGVGSGPRRKP